MKIKGRGCACDCRGFDPNESKCDCYGRQKPICNVGGRRACGRGKFVSYCYSNFQNNSLILDQNNSDPTFTYSCLNNNNLNTALKSCVGSNKSPPDTRFPVNSTDKSTQMLDCSDINGIYDKCVDNINNFAVMLSMNKS